MSKGETTHWKFTMPNNPTTRWQPIATAPRDGTVIDLWEVDQHFGAERVADCRWCSIPIRGGIRDGWGFGLADDPDFLRGDVTHWMPLPEPPHE